MAAQEELEVEVPNVEATANDEKKDVHSEAGVGKVSKITKRLVEVDVRHLMQR